MERPQLIQVDYHDFQSALRRAGDRGRRIDATDREGWMKWVQAHEIKEASFRSICLGRFARPQAVIIDDDSSWSGYYMYSVDDEACMKWQSTLE